MVVADSFIKRRYFSRIYHSPVLCTCVLLLCDVAQIELTGYLTSQVEAHSSISIFGSVTYVAMPRPCSMLRTEIG